ncbi:MAG: antA/AntB antirepressor family protein [Prevotellaceae bacterium]|nr:antA/AntB antirepressor family protein [Prevotellaceae bacterium]
MNELLKIDTETQMVSARDLHEELKVSTRFNDWFPRMCDYGFIEGQDFYSKMSKTSEQGGRPSVDYDITLDMAKQIAMLQRTPEGKQVRQYLIDLEKAWNTPEQVFARALKMADKTIASLNQKVIEMQPKAEYFDALVDRKLNTNVRDTATELHVSERWFADWLVKKGYCYRKESQKGKKGKLMPKADYKDTDYGTGLFTLKDAKSSKNSWVGQQMFITPKGKETFRLLIDKEREIYG